MSLTISGPQSVGVKIGNSVMIATGTASASGSVLNGEVASLAVSGGSVFVNGQRPGITSATITDAAGNTFPLVLVVSL